MSEVNRFGDEERRLMHLVPAPAVRLMKRQVLSRPGVNSRLALHFIIQSPQHYREIITMMLQKTRIFQETSNGVGKPIQMNDKTTPKIRLE